MDVKSQQTKLANNLGRLLRDKFGKGPEAVHVTVKKPFVLVYVRGFISAMEQVLLDQDQEITVKTTREVLMKTIEPEIRGYIKAITEMEIQHLYYDWNLQHQTGMFVGISPEAPLSDNPYDEDFKEKNAVDKEIIQISEQAEKAPESIISYQLSPRAIIVIREGILVPIEKQLIALGFTETLRVAKRQLEGDLLINNTNLPSMLNADILDIFVDWNFEMDNSVIIIIVKPKQ
ncbi:Na-translocating system protein MpsC family protein [Peribacillus sp. SCS-155]|uniref:Na-translocating system protein MpsC family protein n=1 Tax=Peribacillus sedimenti TaxID=3115297 RepID=UPI003905E503